MKTCVILAGGKSSRMGRDKTLLPFGDFKTLTHYQFDKFSKFFKNVFVSSKFNKFNPPLPMIFDENESEFSPMLALAKILTNFKDESIFIIPADMPFVSFQAIKMLAKFKDDFDIVVAADADHTHSLCGFFSSNLAPKVTDFCLRNEHKIGLLRSQANTKIITFSDEKQFYNINYPSEYNFAQESINKGKK